MLAKKWNLSKYLSKIDWMLNNRGFKIPDITGHGVIKIDFFLKKCYLERF
jgi:hypothetical protein